MNMSDRIKEQRKKLDLTQEELADKLGLQKSAIAKYENGRVENIKRSTIAKMSQLFDCAPCYIMALDDPPGLKTESVTEPEYKLLSCFRQLNKTGQARAITALEELAEINRYREEA